MDRIKIAVVEDHTLVREGLIKELEFDAQIEVVIEACHGADMLTQLAAATAVPDIAVIDLSMPVMDGFTLVDELREKYPGIKSLILSAYSSEYNIATMLHKGLKGYLLKDCSPDEFRAAIHEIYEHGHCYSDETTKRLIKSPVKAKAIHIPDREMEFMKLCCTDLRYDQIAEKMGITISTLDGCRERLFARLNITSRIALVLFAMQSGIVAPNQNHSKTLKSKF